MKTFAELYCERHGIPLERFEQVVFQRCLYPQARLLYPVLRAWGEDYFAPDSEFVHSVGLLRQTAGFREDVSQFFSRRTNRGLMRGTLRLRMSAGRLKKLIEAELDGPRKQG
ncbi:MAG: hypothetical protein PHQ04_11685 [Opitutaceae bacterium]|nr:hypothetical protein [Opitutaceae bacterium]